MKKTIILFILLILLSCTFIYADKSISEDKLYNIEYGKSLEIISERGAYSISNEKINYSQATLTFDNGNLKEVIKESGNIKFSFYNKGSVTITNYLYRIGNTIYVSSAEGNVEYIHFNPQFVDVSYQSIYKSCVEYSGSGKDKTCVSFETKTITVKEKKDTLSFVENFDNSITVLFGKDYDPYISASSIYFVADSYSYDASDATFTPIFYSTDSNAGNTSWWNSTSKSIVAIFSFDINNTNALDLSGNNNNATCSNCPVWNSSGHFMFDGDNDLMSIAYSQTMNFTTNFSISGWMKKRDITSDSGNYLIRKGDYSSSFEFGLSSYQKYCTFTLHNGTQMNAESNNCINDTNWHFYTGVWNGTYISIYIDGAFIAKTYVGGSIRNNAYATCIGSNCAGDTGKVNGSINKVRFYNYALHPNQITELYNAQLNNREEKLLAGHTSSNEYWTFNIKSANTDGTYSLSNKKTLYINNASYNSLYIPANTNISDGSLFSRTVYNSSVAILNQSLYFDGSGNEYLELDNTGGLLYRNNRPGSVMLWACPTVLVTSYLLSHAKTGTPGNRFYIGVNSGGLWARVGNTSSDTMDITASSCHHVAVVQNTSRYYVYLDGVLNQTKQVYSTSDLIGNFTVGRYDRSGAENYTGRIDEIYFYDYELSAGAISAYYNSTSGNYSSSSGSGSSNSTNSTYYICENGSDSNDGATTATPWKTLAKVNSIAENSSVKKYFYFCRGGTWMTYYDEQLELKNNSHIDAYGTGAKPLFTGIINVTGSWTSLGSNRYRSPITVADDVGAVYLNGSYKTGFWQFYGKKNLSTVTLSSNREFYYDSGTNTVVMYSSDGNPATAYPGGIYFVFDEDIITKTNAGNVEIYNISAKYTGAHAIALYGSENTKIMYNDVGWIGGCYHGTPSTNRYGNGIQLGLKTINAQVSYNNVTEVYDAALTVQSWSSGGANVINNVTFSYNLINASCYPFEIFSSASGSVLANVSVDHNTFNYYGQHNSYYRDYCRVRFEGSVSTAKNISFTNNILSNNPEDYGGRLFKLATSWAGGMPKMDYNLYYEPVLPYIIETNGSNYATLAAFKLARGQESHGVESDPLYITNTLRPSNISPACTMSSTGSYVGALPCTSESTPTTPINSSVYTNFTLSFTELPYIVNASITLNYTNINTTGKVENASAYLCQAIVGGYPAACGMTNPEYMTDVDMDTYGYLTGTGFDYLYKNYTIPTELLNSNINLIYKYGMAGAGNSLIISCLSGTTLVSLSDVYSFTTQTSSVNVPSSCLNGNSLSIRYQFSKSDWGTADINYYGDYLNLTRELNATLDGTVIYNTTQNGNVSTTINITALARDSVSDLALFFEFWHGYGAYFTYDYDIGYIYTSNIDFNFYLNNGSLVNMTNCTFNDQTSFNMYHLDAVYNISGDNELLCYKTGYNPITYTVTDPFILEYNFTLSTSTLQVLFYDEETEKQITEPMNLIVKKTDYAANYTINNSDFNITYLPEGEIELFYYGQNYATRSYYLTMSQNTTLTLYSMKNDNASLVEFFVSDESGATVSDATLKVQKFFVQDAAWKVIGMEKVDDSGHSGMYLRAYTTPYIFIIEKEGKVIYTSSSSGIGTKIFSSPIYLRASLQIDVLESFRKLRNLNTYLSFDNETKIVSYFFDDSSGIVNRGCLEVTSTNLVRTVRNTTCVESSSATITMNISSMMVNNTKISAKGIVYTTTSYSPKVTDTTDIWNGNILHLTLGLPAVFLSYILIATMFFLGMFISFPVALIYTVFSMMLINILGFTAFGNALIVTVSIMGIFVAMATTRRK